MTQVRYLMFISTLLFGIARAGEGISGEPFGSVTDLTELKELISEHDRVLVSFSVSWCMGCVQMDRTVWKDPLVLAALGSIHQRIRPDESLLDEYRDTYGVAGFPELVLFENGFEAGRLRGVWDSARVIEWIGNPGGVIDPGDPRALPIGDVHDRAVDLMLEQRWEEAARFMCVFWVRSRHDQGMTDTLRWLRSSRYESMLRRVAEDPAARRLIDALWGSMPVNGPDQGLDPRLIDDWLVLSGALGHEAQIDNWIDGMLAREGGRAVLSRHERVFDRLLKLDRAADAGSIASEGMWSRWIARSKGALTGDPVMDAAPTRVVASEARDASNRVRAFIVALRLAGRELEAAALEEEIDS